ncbi:hypothetical protein H4R19_001019 [Coemansia spiralis]|nr:hypothetical protein H4R19_001019 [Coemansia spiralis]
MSISTGSTPSGPKYAVDTSLFDALVDKATGAGSAADATPRALVHRILQPEAGDAQFLSELLAARLADGRGETVLEVGGEEELSDGDVDRITAVLTAAAQVAPVGAFVQLLYDSGAVADGGARTTHARELVAAPKKGVKPADAGAPAAGVTQLRTVHYLVRRQPATIEEMLEVRVAVVGNVDAGKSTMLGVLTQGRLDDGRGKARLSLFRHKHEVDSGRTSSVGMEILGYDKVTGAAVRHTDLHRKAGWDAVCDQSSKLVAFLDLAGHERYLKTTVFGMAGGAPDFVMLMVAANAGLAGMAKEHLGLALALSIPVFIVITKIDMCPPHILDTTLKQLSKLLRSSGCRKLPVAVQDRRSVVMAAARCVSQRVCPVFQISNVTGEGVDLLQLFLNILPLSARPAAGPCEADADADTAPLRFDINELFSVPFVGTVVSGVVASGSIRSGDTVWLGPDYSGGFIATAVRGIQRKRADVQAAHAGQSVSLALKKISRSQVRRGMVILGRPEPQHQAVAPPRASRTFEAEVVVLYHTTTITSRYQAMVHCGSVRQTARVLSIKHIDSGGHTDDTALRTGDRARVVFQFIRHPEFIPTGSRLIFREGRTKGVGKVVRVLAPAEELQAVSEATNGAMSFGSRKEKAQMEALRHQHGPAARAEPKAKANKLPAKG